MRILLVLMFLSVVGCGRSEEKTTVKTRGGTVKVEGEKVTIQTDKGKATIESKGNSTRIQTDEGTISVGDSDVPDGFPLPVISGAKVEHGAHMTSPDGGEVFQLSIAVPTPVKQLAEFYEKAFRDKGLKVTRNEQTSDEAQMVMLFGESEKVQATVTVIQEAGADQPNATISWSLKKQD